MVLPEDLPEELTRSQRTPRATPTNLKDVLDAAHRDAIEKAFRRTNGDLKETAKLLGLNRTYIYRVVKRLGLQRSGEMPN
jgi:transcriptional regulator of acetoin/glycerol metabolism